jgi:hypothetical protein
MGENSQILTVSNKKKAFFQTLDEKFVTRKKTLIMKICSTTDL